MTFHPQGQGLDTSKDQPGDLRSDVPAIEFPGAVTGAFHDLAASDDNTGRQIAVPAQILGGAVDNSINTNIQRPLIKWRRKGIISDGFEPTQSGQFYN